MSTFQMEIRAQRAEVGCPKSLGYLDTAELGSRLHGPCTQGLTRVPGVTGQQRQEQFLVPGQRGLPLDGSSCRDGLT